MIVITLVLLLIGFLTFQHFRAKPEKILGVYTKPGKWFYLKYVVFLTLLTAKRTATWFKRKLTADDLEDLEKPKNLSRHEKAFDAVFFQGVNRDGFYICAGVEKRHKGKINGLFYLVVPELGLLRNPHLPKTEMDADSDVLYSMKHYGGQGISFVMVEPMKKWKIAYKGKMKTDSEEFDVDLEAVFTSNNAHFMYDTDFDISAIAKAIAREEWSREYFDTLKSAHQSHYEQMGFIKGNLTINGKKYELNLDGFRDHSFGYKRDWSLMHRYAFHMFYLDDNTRICCGVISQPCTTSHLEMGYILTPKGVCHPIESCDLLLYQHGESGQPPKDLGFTFIANKKPYNVKVVTKYEHVHYKGNDVEARLVEKFTTCEVNGVKGNGIAEWHYNNITKN